MYVFVESAFLAREPSASSEWRVYLMYYSHETQRDVNCLLHLDIGKSFAII